MKPCPACGKPNDDASKECKFCSIVFEKWKHRTSTIIPSAPSTTQVFLPTSIIKIGVAIVVLFVPIWFLSTVMKSCSRKAANFVINPDRVKELIDKGNLPAVQGAIENGATKISAEVNCELLSEAVDKEHFAIFHALISSGMDVSGTNCMDRLEFSHMGPVKNQPYFADLDRYHPELHNPAMPWAVPPPVMPTPHP